MRLPWNSEPIGGFWLAPASFGLLLIVFGVLILIVEWLLRFIVAGILILAGFSLLGLAWRLRGRVTYRRIDTGPPPPDEC